MKNKTFLLALGISCLAAVMVVATSSNGIINDYSFYANAQDGSTTLTLNSLRTPELTDGSGSLVLDEYQTFNYTGASLADGKHVVLSNEGTMYKVEESRELRSINVVFDGSLILITDYVSIDAKSRNKIELTSNSLIDISGNYWKIEATSETSITSVTITYGCKTAAQVPTVSLADTDGYAYLDTNAQDGHLHFVVQATLTNEVNPVASDFSLVDWRDGVITTNITACSLEKEGTALKIHFDLTEGLADQSSSLEHIYTHMFIRGRVAFGDNGDIARNSYSPTEGNLVNSDYGRVQLVKESWNQVSLLSTIGTINRSNSSDYASLSSSDGSTIDLVLKGTYVRKAGVSLAKESLSITDTDVDITATSVEESDASTVDGITTSSFVAKFPLNSVMDGPRITNTDGNRRYTTSEVWPHLKFNGLAFDNESGDLKDVTISESACVAKNTRFRLWSGSSEPHNLKFHGYRIDQVQFNDFYGLTAEQGRTYYPFTLSIDDNRVWFEISGHYFGNFDNYKISADSVELRDGSTSVIGQSITYENTDGGTRFKVKFDITDWASKEKTDGKFVFYSHCYLNGNTFDGSENGDLKPLAFSDYSDDYQNPNIDSGLRKAELNGAAYRLKVHYKMAVIEIQ